MTHNRTLDAILTRHNEHALLAAIARRLAEGPVVLDYRSGELELQEQTAAATCSPSRATTQREETR